MAGLIPEEIVETIRSRADIVQIISQYVTLQKKGRNYVGRCPFHQDSDPSFTVAPEKQIFHCFGCSTGGNVFKFIMLQHNYSFPEAVKMLGEEVGIVVPETYSPQVRELLRKKENAWQINALAKDFYQSTLIQHPEASKAKAYVDQRGLNGETVKDFGIGYALASWDALIKYMHKKGVSTADLLSVGLVASGERNVYDRFRSRLMFPIADARDRVVGFGGRVLDEGSPKYLNTAETDFFNKGGILYGLNRAKQSIKEMGYCVIVEGYMDVVTAHQYGVSNAVASLGTSLTKEHGQLIMNFTKEVVIAYDTDVAGVAAAVRGLDILQLLGCRVRVLSLPEGKDPDEFLRARGVEQWKRQIEKSFSLIDFKIQRALSKYNNEAGFKDAVLEEILPSLVAIPGELEKNEAIRQIAAQLFTSYHVVLEQVQKLTNTKKLTGNSLKKSIIPDKVIHNKHNIDIKKDNVNFGEIAENGLIRLIIEDSSLMDQVTESLTGNFFQNDFYREVYAKLLDIHERGESYVLSAVFDYLAEEYQGRLSALIMKPIPGENFQLLVNSYIKAIRRRQLIERRWQLQSELADAEKAGDFEHITRILREINFADQTLKGGEMLQ